MAWKPEVFIASENKWCHNALVFATRDEAERNARDLLLRWFVPTDSRAVESSDPVNYRYVDGVLIAVPRDESIFWNGRDEGPGYSAVAVDKAIAASNRGGKRISKREAKAIHSLLSGRRGAP